MKAAMLTDIRRIEVHDVPDVRLTRPGDVLLAVQTVGICGSDMHYYTDGRIGSVVVEEFPWILGHECAATVLEAGPAVENLRPGDRVTVDPLIWCGRCDQCLAGRVHTCRNQAFLGCPHQAPGALAERIVMPAASCCKIPDSMSFQQATLAEPLSVALHTVRLAAAGPGAKVAILGVGPIGLSVLAAQKAAGDCLVYATDLLDNRLDLARRLGADWTGNAADGRAAAEIARAEPLGLDVVFECAGEQETINQGLELLAPGGALVIVGIPPEDRAGFDMNHMRRKELRVQNIRRQNECLAPAVDMLHGGRVNLDSLITHRFPLEDTDRAFQIASSYQDGVVKAIINIAGDGP